MFRSKTAIVTGGASGIGEAVATALARAGASVCIADADLTRAEAVARRLGSEVMATRFDLRDTGSIEKMVSTSRDRFGGVDILVNSAGVFGLQSFLDITPAEFDRIVGINARGLLFTTQAAARAMIECGNGGAIVNVTSTAGRRGAAGSGCYSASKAAAISLTRIAATELIAHGIRVNAVAPGVVRTPLWEEVKRTFAAGGAGELTDFEAVQMAATPAKRLAEADDIVGAILFLAGPQSRHIIGQTINVDGGVMMD
jgi:NAD(P)-dependent dehydrogenase (short-subunit alcohol dehydrogenase family)